MKIAPYLCDSSVENKVFYFFPNQFLNKDVSALLVLPEYFKIQFL